MRKILFYFIITTSNFLFAKEKKLKHSIESDLLITFQPNKKFQIIESKKNTGLELHTYIFKKYKYPGLNISYKCSYPIKKKSEIGIKIGINIRYLEPYFVNFNTYYSVPLLLFCQQTIYQNNKNNFSTNIHTGYNLKHPKYKTFDGIGGFTFGIEIIKTNKLNRTYLKLGYDFYQEKGRLFWPYSQFGFKRILQDETYRFNQYLNQIKIGFGVYIK